VAQQVTENELLAALRQAFEKPSSDDEPPGVMTTAELSDSLGISRKTVRRLLGKIDRQGMLEVHNIYRPTLHRQTVEVPGYRLKEKMED
jgi:DeoR/GlpR family transcriptional regulator of sugar metabolism